MSSLARLDHFCGRNTLLELDKQCLVIKLTRLLKLGATAAGGRKVPLGNLFFAKRKLVGWMSGS
jgi:hypothetical protein